MVGEEDVIYTSDRNALAESAGVQDALIAKGNFERSPHQKTRVSKREAMALQALADEYCRDFGYLTFRSISALSGLEQAHVRRTVRALARKGLAEYAKGLWTEDGQLAGAGYRCTTAGLELAASFPAAGRPQ